MDNRTTRVLQHWLLSFCFLGVVLVQPTALCAQSVSSAPVVAAGTLDDRARVLFFSQDRNVWVTYDTELGNLYRIWVGGLEDPSLRSPSFLTQSPSLQGTLLLSNKKEQKWKVIRKGEAAIPDVSFLGFRWDNNQVVLEYELETTYGQKIQVEERPRIALDNDRPVIERSFKVFNVPEDIQVGLEISAEKMKQYSDLDVAGVFQRIGEKKHAYYWGAAYDVHGRLILDEDTTTSVTITFSPDIIENTAKLAVLESSPIPSLRSIQAIESEGVQPILRRRSDHEVGLSMRLYGIGEPIEMLTELAPGQLPNVNEVVPQIDLTQKDQFGGLDFYFITHLSGYLNIASPGEFSFRVLADDGFRLAIADSILLEMDGLQAAQPSEDVTVSLSTGVHPIEIEHFQSTGKKQLTVLWQPPWRSSYEVLGAPVVSTRKEKQRFHSASRKYVKRPFDDDALNVPRISLNKLHPSIQIEEIPVPGLNGFIGGLDMLSNGSLVIATWESDGQVIVLEGDVKDPSSLQTKQIATGLNKPLGLKVVDDEIFVFQQHELTQLIDNDGNELIDEYRVVSNQWEISTDYTELAIGLEYKQGSFLGVLGMPLDRDGAILIEDIHHRGILVRIGFDGSQQIIEAGMQLSGGIAMENGYVAISDQRNPWFSDSRILFMPDDFGTSFQNAEPEALTLSSIWLPVNSGQNPAQPFYVNRGAYKGDWIVGDMVSTPVFRVGIDHVSGQIQGAVFPFLENMPMNMSRMVELPDGSVVVGGASLQQPWGQIEHNTTSLYHMDIEDKMAFEMRSIRSVSGGFDIEFTKPVRPNVFSSEDVIALYQWPNSETRRDRTRKRGGREKLEILSVELLEDGKTARVLVEGGKEGHIVYFNLDPAVRSVENEKLWSNEAWYSLNVLRETVSDAP